MFNNHKVVVAMTSWTKRIQNCFAVVSAVLNNTVKPDLVYLNLSLEEFPKRERELPQNLVELSKKNPSFKINWVPGPNTKSMKKVFPILKYLDDDDIIITVDDDFELPDDFIQIRLKEFQDCDCKCVISSENKPEWHYRTLYGLKYWGIGSGSLFTKRCFGGYDKIVNDQLIQTYNDDVVYALFALSNGFWIEPSKIISNQSGIGPRKIKYFNDIEGMTKTRAYNLKINEIVEIFEDRFNSAFTEHSLKDVISKTIMMHDFNLVILDSNNVAGDNGEYFYRWMMKKHPELKMRFLISNKHEDWKRLEKDGFNLYPIEGNELSKVLDNASFILWSKDSSVNHKGLAKNTSKSIFLGHGYTGRVYEDAFYLGGYIPKYAKYMVSCSDDEKKTILEYSDDKLQVLLTGFPRHDFLLEKAKTTPPEKQVLISFHLREYKTKQELSGSDYYKNIQKFLNCDELKSIHDMGVKIVFLPHARFISNGLAKYFTLPDHIELSKKMFQDVLADSSLLITDFSSNSFEMAYMNRPTIVYVPDEHFVRKNLPRYHIDNIMNYPHIFKCDDVEQVVSKTREFLTSEKPFDFAKKLFKYVDQNNSKRLLDWMLDRYNQQ